MPSVTQKLLFIFGTRPEAIKMAPVILECARRPEFEVKVAVTAQHRQMLDQVLQFFGIVPDYDLGLMKPNQSLFDITADGLRKLEPVLDEVKPDVVFVQGDTTTAFIGALAAYYKKIKVAHIEAGLRSYNKYSPFPEEINRVLTGHLADIHFAPTVGAANNLQLENINDNVHVVGNTVIDALLLGLELIKGEKGDAVRAALAGLPIEKKFVLITGHRRESFGLPFENICAAIKSTAQEFSDVHFIYPVHLNPNVVEPVHRLLDAIPNVHLVAPMEYPQFIALMERCHLVLTDSGGIQEEAPALGKPVLVMRAITERLEGIDSGTARLVGTSKEKIQAALRELLLDEKAYSTMANAVNPYGDGTAAQQIATIISSI